LESVAVEVPFSGTVGVKVGTALHVGSAAEFGRRENAGFDFGHFGRDGEVEFFQDWVVGVAQLEDFGVNVLFTVKGALTVRHSYNLVENLAGEFDHCSGLLAFQLLGVTLQLPLVMDSDEWGVQER
jgi:hypothetical protein